MILPLWLDIDWEYEDGTIMLKSVECYCRDILPYLNAWQIEKIKANCMEKQQEMWSEQI